MENLELNELFSNLGITLVSLFAIVSGVNEVVVGVTGNFIGIISKPIRRALYPGGHARFR